MPAGSAAPGWVECFVGSGDALRPSDAAVALLVVDDGRYVMQLRDILPHIFYPGHWGCFGGAIEEGESAVAALCRELGEELEFKLAEAGAEQFTRFEFDFSRVGQGRVSRTYYEVRVTPAEVGRFVLHEGAAYEALDGSELLTNRKVTPYDAFAVWMHMSKKRFEPSRGRAQT